MNFFENPKIDRFFDLFFAFFLILILLMEGVLFYNLKDKKILESEQNNQEINFKSENAHQENEIEEKEVNPQNKEVMVDIKGAVKKPGVYKVLENSIVNDVIKLAGGLKSTASTKNINLSKKVTDEMVITIFTLSQIDKLDNPNLEICNCPTIDINNCKNCPIIETSKDKVDNNETNNNPSNKKISLNKASKEELMALTGIGESKALAIIEYREKNNGFKSLEELMNVSGIGEKAYEKIKDNITL